LITAKGHANLHAQSGDVEIVGDKNVRLYANKQKLTLAAGQELLLTCAGAYVRLKGGDIEIHAPGSVSFKGSGFDFSGPASMAFENEMPQGKVCAAQNQVAVAQGGATVPVGD
ncbi:DUF2345 domain-containing protein, partial [Chitiniphilus eburneus]